jgi:hypothetical protein
LVCDMLRVMLEHIGDINKTNQIIGGSMGIFCRKGGDRNGDRGREGEAVRWFKG